MIYLVETTVCKSKEVAVNLRTEQFSVSYLKKYMYRLRIKLKDNKNPQPMLVTERGVGYKFVRPE